MATNKSPRPTAGEGSEKSTGRLRMLDRRLPLARQVAEVLWERKPGTLPVDLGDVEVWVPTGGAARRIRWELTQLAATAGTGVLSPLFFQPMAALLPRQTGIPLATREEIEGAWALTLRESAPEELDAIFPPQEITPGDTHLLGAGAMLGSLCDLLAEAGLHPGSRELEKACEQDIGRWKQLANLHRQFSARLKRSGRLDPNAARRAQTGHPHAGSGVKRLVIAAVADLPSAAACHAAGLANAGVSVEVLVWNPGIEGFDPWGRPLPADWTPLPLHDGQILRANDPEDEVAQVLEFAARAENDYAVLTADPALLPALEAGVLRLQGEPFIPEGECLALTEPGRVALGWMDWTRGGLLRVLRRLLESPVFAGWLASITHVSPTKMLEIIDRLAATAIAETREQARGFLACASEKTLVRAGLTRAGELLAILEAQNSTEIGHLLERLWPANHEGAADAERVLELWHGIEASPVFREWPEGREPSFQRALRAASTFTVCEPGQVELSGWLEAPWCDAARLAVCGCVEGRLPASVTEHAFLPDSVRATLGLTDNAARQARDAYLLACLIRTRKQEDFLCSFSKFGSGGNPGLPSSLLLRCPEEQLVPRVLELFREAKQGGQQPVRANRWLWSLPPGLRKDPPDRISPTDFSQYLSCPFRYYFKRVLSMEDLEPGSREMDARQFGSLLHQVLEYYHPEHSGKEDEKEIAAAVLKLLNTMVREAFGPAPAPAVRVQIEAMKVRLLGFAWVQALSMQEGWRILKTERKLSADDTPPLKIGSLPLSAKIDRIEHHPEHGIRVMDYKSSFHPKRPQDAHFGPASSRDFLPEASVQVNGRARAWADLQLPLYRSIAAHWYPGKPVHTGYFLLPADPACTAIELLDLTDDLIESAQRCAEAVVARVRDREFWPPQAFRWKGTGQRDPFEPLFLNGTPENCFDSDTLEFFRGRSGA